MNPRDHSFLSHPLLSVFVLALAGCDDPADEAALAAEDAAAELAERGEQPAPATMVDAHHDCVADDLDEAVRKIDDWRIEFE